MFTKMFTGIHICRHLVYKGVDEYTIMYTLCLRYGLLVNKPVHTLFYQYVYRIVIVVNGNVHIDYILFTILHLRFFSGSWIEESSNLLYS